MRRIDKSGFSAKKKFKSLRSFQTDKFCRFVSCCDYLPPYHSEKGNNNITNEIRVELENLEKASKEGFNQLKATAQHKPGKLNWPILNNIQSLK